MIVDGKVCNFIEFGVFVEIMDDIDGLIYVFDMSWIKCVKYFSEVLEKGDDVCVCIMNIDILN